MEVKDKQPTEPIARLDLEAVRDKLKGKSGKLYWRSLEEVAETPEFDQWMEDEFPHRATLKQINRRDLLKFMGASMALAGLTGCRGVFMPQEKLVPYVKAPEEMVPGVPLFYASSVLLAGYATGVLVEQREGRPIKLEGNPEHPASLGALDSLSQAELLNLYDPDRAQSVEFRGNISTWELFGRGIGEEMAKFKKNGGEGLVFLTGAISSPSLLDSFDRLMRQYPNAKWHRYEPVGRGGVYEGIAMVKGSPREPVYDFTNAGAILSLDGDFLGPTGMPGSLAYARQFASGRRVRGKHVASMNRLYSIESMPTSTGATADHRWPVKAAQVWGVALAMANALQRTSESGDLAGIDAAHFQTMLDDLRQNNGVVVAGDQHPAEVHALVAMINDALGAEAAGRVSYKAPVDGTIGRAGSLNELITSLNSGSVDTLFILGGNPAYDAPSDFDFAANLAKARLKVHHTMYDNETSHYCDWILPSTHYLEEWGDGRAYNGGISMMQPIIAPLFDGRSASEVISMLAEKPKGSYDIVRGFWQRSGLGNGNFELAWRNAVHDGVIKDFALPEQPFGNVTSSGSFAAPASSGLEVIFRADPTIYDGRFANNGWLQELPKPMTKMTWDNTIIMSPNMAISNKLIGDDLVRLTYRDVVVEGGCFIQPGHPDDSITVHLGYGRTRGGAVATVTGDYGGGFNAYLLRRSDAMYYGSGASIEKIGGQMNLATTQTHQPIEASKRAPGMEGSVIPQTAMDHRELVYEWTVPEFNEKVEEILEEKAKRTEEFDAANLYPEEIFEWNGQQWAMTIDLTTCIACNACVTACQAENNIPVVGKPAVGRHREMHWIRIDRYYSGITDNPAVVHQPVMCVHCEMAPCEPVCPVAATVHSHDGLNQMVYNRCVGTRYCSNNCPYKVRRFNYLNFSDNQLQFAPQTDDKARRPLLKLLNNPDVTVRGRGVMEKCTYCVQRINQARIEAKKANKAIPDGTILTACQQACPTETIVFGDQTDKNSKVAALRQDPRAYMLLEELNTRPRTSHLARLRNPNPLIAPAKQEAEL
jgi:molybdopterin-containing oxidoreductase family iron-sulfur binding subunit